MGPTFRASFVLLFVSFFFCEHSARLFNGPGYDGGNEEDEDTFVSLDNAKLMSMIAKGKTWHDIRREAQLPLSHEERTRPQILREQILRTRFNKCRKRLAQQTLMTSTEKLDSDFNAITDLLHFKKKTNDTKNEQQHKYKLKRDQERQEQQHQEEEDMHKNEKNKKQRQRKMDMNEWEQAAMEMADEQRTRATGV